MANLGVVILSAFTIGIIFGVISAIIVAFIKTFVGEKRALKKNKDIVDQIKSQEVKDGNRKEEGNSGRETTGEPIEDRKRATAEPVSESSSEDKPNERERVQIPKSGFTFRD